MSRVEAADAPSDRSGRPWTAEEDAYLLRNAFLPAATLAERLGRSVPSVLRRLVDLRCRQEEGR